MAVMGGIIGAGIFINPYLVADRVHTSALILSAWIVGGLIALLGGFIYAELAARLPVVGGQYAYLREALIPAVAFLYGWVLLLVIQTGGMAAVAVTFAKYFLELTGWQFQRAACCGLRAGFADDYQLPGGSRGEPGAIGDDSGGDCRHRDARSL